MFRVNRVTSILTILITLLIATHEPPKVAKYVDSKVVWVVLLHNHLVRGVHLAADYGACVWSRTRV